MKRKTMIVSAALAVATLAGGVAQAQNVIRAQTVASGFSRPVFAVSPAGDNARLFVVEQRGSAGVSNRADIDIIDLTTNTVLPTPFFSTASAGFTVTTGSEQGLLGFAFDPNYASNRYFYIHYTNSSGTSVVSRWQTSATDPNVTDYAAGGLVILTQPQPFSNHNGGWIGFGPDNLLYIAWGDGGSSNDPQGNSLRLDTLLGKMVRIDVSNATQAQPYAIPPTNPFVGQPSVRGEIYHYGLRNHWRNSFDRLTGDLWMGDVGQNAREEINRAAAGVGGLNFGWRCFEGNIITPAIGAGGLQFPGGPSCPGASPPPSWIFPVIDYDRTSGRCSVTGGYVYRGVALPWLRGNYFYADYCGGQIYTIPNTGVNPPITNWTAQLTGATGFGIVSFGEDNRGELYVVNQSGGTITRIEPTCRANCDGSSGSPALTPADFVCFLNAYRAGDQYANCDGSTGNPALTPADFVCYLSQFRAGC